MENRIAITTPEYVKLEFETAGLGSRTLSLLIDWMILGVVQFILIFLASCFLPLRPLWGIPFGPRSR